MKTAAILLSLVAAAGINAQGGGLLAGQPACAVRHPMHMVDYTNPPSPPLISTTTLFCSTKHSPNNIKASSL